MIAHVATTGAVIGQRPSMQQRRGGERRVLHGGPHELADAVQRDAAREQQAGHARKERQSTDARQHEEHRAR